MKFLHLLCLAFISISCATTDSSNKINLNGNEDLRIHFQEKLSSKQIKQIKKYYNWKDQELLVIHYRQPKAYCKYDYYKSSGSSEWVKNHFSLVDYSNCLNIRVFADSFRFKENMLDNITQFGDKEYYLLDNFFYRKESCSGLMIINQKGNYFQYNGYYTARQTQRYIDLLR